MSASAHCESLNHQSPLDSDSGTCGKIMHVNIETWTDHGGTKCTHTGRKIERGYEKCEDTSQISHS